MKYCLVVEDDLDKFLHTVQKLIDAGWKPQGGIAVSHGVFTDRDDCTVSSPVWAQAMVYHE